MSDGGGLASAGGSEYTVVLRASSSAYFLPEEGWEHHFSLPGLGIGTIRTRAFTRWVAVGSHSVPRELVIEVKGRAGSLDEAGARFSMIARPIANMIAFVANVRVGPLEAHLAFDSDPDRTERQFLEVFLPDERGGFSQGRIIRRHLLEVACPAGASLPVDGPRVGRALRQYELALREWYVGGEWLALSHLWIAVENLTEAVVRRTMLELSKTDEELAQMLDVMTDDPERPRWQQIMREQVREQIIFDGDHDTYTTAKKASDGLEHGFLELDEVARRAIASADTTFTCVRRTIIDLLDLPREIGAEVMAIKPKDVQSARKAIRGRLVGAAADPAADGHMYPLLEWASSIDSVVREGAAFHVKPTEQVTVRTNPAVQFSFDRIEMIGRLAEGEQPRQLREDEVSDQLGIAIPDTLPDPESAAIYRNLNAEMHLARSTWEGSYAIAGLHIQTGTEQSGFHTKRQPDSFTDMITTACVMAQLDLLKRAASLFNWSLDVTRADELIAKATAMNSAAAQGEPAAQN